jgi:hypothetical protein
MVNPGGTALTAVCIVKQFAILRAAAHLERACLRRSRSSYQYDYQQEQYPILSHAFLLTAA